MCVGLGGDATLPCSLDLVSILAAKLLAVQCLFFHFYSLHLKTNCLILCNNVIFGIFVFFWGGVGAKVTVI